MTMNKGPHPRSNDDINYEKPLQWCSHRLYELSSSIKEQTPLSMGRASGCTSQSCGLFHRHEHDGVFVTDRTHGLGV